jgi:hypothetical protein
MPLKKKRKDGRGPEKFSKYAKIGRVDDQPTAASRRGAMSAVFQNFAPYNLVATIAVARDS